MTLLLKDLGNKNNLSRYSFKFMKIFFKRLYSYIFSKINNISYTCRPPLVSFSSKIKLIRAKILFYGSRETDVIISPNTEIRILDGSIYFGHNFRMKEYSKIKVSNGSIKLGNNVSLQRNSILQSGSGGILIGNNVRIAPNVTMFATNHKFDDPNKPIHLQGLSSKGIKIGDNVWIGSGVIILDGVKIGSSTVIGAGSVVTKSFNNNLLIAGNPAKIIRDNN